MCGVVLCCAVLLLCIRLAQAESRHDMNYSARIGHGLSMELLNFENVPFAKTLIFLCSLKYLKDIYMCHLPWTPRGPNLPRSVLRDYFVCSFATGPFIQYLKEKRFSDNGLCNHSNFY